MTQAKHLIATKTNDRPLVGSGVDKALAYQMSDTFAFKAKEDGKVTSINEKTGLMLVEYINGDKDVIDISEKLAKNSNGGFYQTNKLTPQFEVGKKFNKGQVLAKNDSYFAGSGSNNDIQFAAGKLSKVAVASSYGIINAYHYRNIMYKKYLIAGKSLLRQSESLIYNVQRLNNIILN